MNLLDYKEQLQKNILDKLDDAVDIFDKDNLIVIDYFKLFIHKDEIGVMYNVDNSASFGAWLQNELSKIFDKVPKVLDGYFIYEDSIIMESEIEERNTGFILTDEAKKKYGLIKEKE